MTQNISTQALGIKTKEKTKNSVSTYKTAIQVRNVTQKWLMCANTFYCNLTCYKALFY